MTIGEVKRMGEGINWRTKKHREEQASFDYIQASLITRGIGIILGSKQKFPSIHETYPDIFEQSDEAVQELKNQQSIARFIKFANNFNANFKGSEDK